MSTLVHMTRLNAIKFASAFTKDLIGKPIYPNLNQYKITESEIINDGDNGFLVLLVAEHEEEHIIMKSYLLEYLNVFGIEFNREEFGFPQKD